MKNIPIRKTLHLSPDICDALKTAAQRDRRSISSMAEILLRDGLRANKAIRGSGVGLNSIPPHAE